jgi:acyl-CoA reductase-like NAD-dependent aldehyde dehydrogenase
MWLFCREALFSREETFGPVVSVIEVEGEDERIGSGMVYINDQTVSDEPPVPFGGRAGLEEFTELRWISMQLSPRHYPF